MRSGILYIGNNEGEFFAINLQGGKIRWRYLAKSSLMSNALIWNDLVIVGEGNRVYYFADKRDKTSVRIGTSENAIIGLDAATGALRWRTPVSGSAMATGAIINGRFLVHDGAGEIVTLDPRSGTVLHKIVTDSIASMSAILPDSKDQYVSIGASNNVVEKRALEADSPIWRARPNDSAWGVADCPPASDGASLFCDYVAPPSSAAVLWFGKPATEHAYAIDLADGSIRWDVALDRGVLPYRNLASIPLSVDKRVYVGSAVAPYVRALDSVSGKSIWRAHVKGPVKGGICYKEGILYFGDLFGYLWSVDARTGRIVGSKNMRTSFNVGSPVVVGNTLVIGSNTGAVIAVPLDVIRASRDE